MINFKRLDLDLVRIDSLAMLLDLTIELSWWTLSWFLLYNIEEYWLDSCKCSEI